jgi:hypothetical protein
VAAANTRRVFVQEVSHDHDTLSRICGADGSGRRCTERPLPERPNRFRHHSWAVRVADLRRPTGIFRRGQKRGHAPPGIAFIFIPVLVLLVLSILGLRSSAGARVALAFPLWIILGAQSFRIVVELFLHQLWIDGLGPKMLTFAGANVDIYVGASAPLIAWLSTRGRSGMKLALIWNVLGLLSLTNVVIRAVLTAPGPFNLIHAEVPNLMIGTFPFMFIPGFFVPLAVVLHVLAVRAIASTICLM